MAGDSAVVVSPYGFCVTDLSGSAYLLERQNGIWSQRHKLCASDGTPEHLFGFLEAAISGDTVVIGAPGDNDDGWRSGAVYLFSIPLFSDGFETNDTSAWAATVP
jgi:hypothetical protein